MKNEAKTARQLERHFKGASNHWRIEILILLNKCGGMSLEGIVEELDMNVKTASEHTRRLVVAGLVNKKYVGRKVEHSLSPYGKKFANFIRTFQHS